MSVKSVSYRKWFLLLVFVALLAWWAADRYIANNWVHHSYPVNGAIDVPRDAKIMVTWKGTRSNNLGMTVRYADAPDEHIPGTSMATLNGLSFQPEKELEPGKEMIVRVEAGRRNHSFTFTTAKDNRKVE